MNLSAIAAVVRFEWHRMLTPSRISGWLLLTLFPPLLVLLIELQNAATPDWEPLVIFSLVVIMLCVLSLLLWVAPVIHTELDSKSWAYLAVRPNGRSAVAMGKYLSGAIRTIISGWISMTLCVIISQPPDPMRLWGALFLLVPLSAFAYGAIFLLIAVIFHRRAMVIASAYTLLFEVVVSLLPAVINTLTIQYRLRSILKKLLNQRATVNGLFSDAPVINQLLILLAMTIFLLVVANLIVNRREYVRADHET